MAEKVMYVNALKGTMFLNCFLPLWVLVHVFQGHYVFLGRVIWSCWSQGSCQTPLLVMLSKLDFIQVAVVVSS